MVRALVVRVSARAVWGAGAIAFLAPLSCRSATEVVVVVTTDVDCTSVQETVISVGSTSEVDAKAPATSATGCVDGKIGALVIVPSGGDSDEVAVRVATSVGTSAHDCTGASPTGGCIVARRALRFSAHESLRVPIAMRASCIDVSCTGSDFKTCVRGVCVPATIGDSSACTGDGCGESTLPGAPASIPDAGTGDAPSEASTDASFEAGADAASDAPVASDAGDAAPPVGADGTWIQMHAPPAGFAARQAAGAVWTGSRVIVWGGDLEGSYANDGAAYDPAQDSWTVISGASGLSARPSPIALWTGSEMIVWGGTSSQNDGARYDPNGDSWKPMATPPAGFKARSNAAAVWTGTEMVVWGGLDDVGNILDDGAAYAPSTNTWRTLAATSLAPRFGPSATYDGARVRIFGGSVGGGTYNAAGASYDSAADRADAGAPWADMPAIGFPFDGRLEPTALLLPPGAGTHARSMFLGGGDWNNDWAIGNGIVFDPDAPAANAWTFIVEPGNKLNNGGDYAGRLDTFTWFGAGRAWTWGGVSTDHSRWAPRGDGAAYSFVTSSWATMPGGGPSPRSGGVAVWTTDRAVLWGGVASADGGATAYLADGYMFVPK